MEIIIIVLLIIIVGTLFLGIRQLKGIQGTNQLENLFKEVNTNLERIETNLKTELKTELKTNREENSNLSKSNRDELSNNLEKLTKNIQEDFKEIRSTVDDKLDKFSAKLEENSKNNRDVLDKIIVRVEEKLNTINQQVKNDSFDNRNELSKALKLSQDNLEKNVLDFKKTQKETLDELQKTQKDSFTDLVKETEKKLESIRTTVEEKLEKTLSERLGQSFETVGKHLIEVQKGLGEMQNIATEVGSLKKVLGNVKLRGGVGEIQLAMLLEQILAPNQYEANVKTKKDSNAVVEFAIKLPGKTDNEDSVVYLPIDAKFPKDIYEHLINAYEKGQIDEIENATKNLEITIRKMAKDISEKYIDPPKTTDFAIMFLPFESIYAEVIRRSALVDLLRDEYKILIAGPTTLWALLHSLQTGFRTLSLQKKSSEVWNVLIAVKKEFENFGGLLEKAKNNFQIGLGQLNEVSGTRTRAINRSLRDIEDDIKSTKTIVNDVGGEVRSF